MAEPLCWEWGTRGPFLLVLKEVGTWPILALNYTDQFAFPHQSGWEVTGRSPVPGGPITQTCAIHLVASSKKPLGFLVHSALQHFQRESSVGNVLVFFVALLTALLMPAPGPVPLERGDACDYLLLAL